MIYCQQYRGMAGPAESLGCVDSDVLLFTS